MPPGAFLPCRHFLFRYWTMVTPDDISVRYYGIRRGPGNKYVPPSIASSTTSTRRRIPRISGLESVTRI